MCKLNTWEPVFSLGGTAFSILGGILGAIFYNIVLHKWKFRRGGIEDFVEGIKDEIVALSNVSDNLDGSIVSFHRASCRRLEAYAIILMDSSPKSWNKIKEAYEAYTFKDKEKEVHNYVNLDKNGVDGRRGLMKLLSNLLHEIRKI